eukprot:Rhum_TRINITY_DN14082_c31_g1::Rhum_TRINITY_DN14082_c31_g1_i1::g.67214::m.67214/K01110/PTEN; phosphatidylinositol-3,4,5-trisphosphate 3-phosphatase and dual-specificity protein phosphatase PTEN
MPSSRRPSVFEGTDGAAARGADRFSNLQRYMSSDQFHVRDDYDEWELDGGAGSGGGNGSERSRNNGAATARLPESPRHGTHSRKPSVVADAGRLDGGDGGGHPRERGASRTTRAPASPTPSQPQAPPTRGGSPHFLADPRDLSATARSGASPPGSGGSQQRPAKNTRNVRSLVSKNKVRFQEEGFDLDLAYITPNIIAMGFPSSGAEGYYRNQVDDVERFFSQRHSGHYFVYNLCSERIYDTDARFGGQHCRFPFEDHNPPVPISIIPSFIQHAQAWLSKAQDNVIAVHCKAGKGRTGVLISCYLLAEAFQNTERGMTSHEARAYFGKHRTKDGKGVTIPSQIRYVNYWEHVLRELGGRLPPTRRFYVEAIRVVSTIKDVRPTELYFTISVGEKDVGAGTRREVFNSSKDLKGTAVRERGALTFDVRPHKVSVHGDVMFQFRKRNNVLSDDNLFHFWVNTDVEADVQADALAQDRTLFLRIAKKELDKAVKDKENRTSDADLAVEVRLVAADTHASSRTVSPGSSPTLHRAGPVFSPMSLPSSSPTEPPSPMTQSREQSPATSPHVHAAIPPSKKLHSDRQQAAAAAAAAAKRRGGISDGFAEQ